MKYLSLAILGIALFLTSANAGDNQQISVQQSVGRQGFFRRPAVNQSVVIGQPAMQFRQPVYVQQVRVIRQQVVARPQQIRVIRQQVVAQPQYVQQVRQQVIAQPQYVQQVRVIRQQVVAQPQYVQQVRYVQQTQYVQADPPPVQQEVVAPPPYSQNIVTGQLGSCPAPQIQQEVTQPSCAPAQQLRSRFRY